MHMALLALVLSLPSSPAGATVSPVQQAYDNVRHVQWMLDAFVNRTGRLPNSTTEFCRLQPAIYDLRHLPNPYRRGWARVVVITNPSSDHVRQYPAGTTVVVLHTRPATMNRYLIMTIDDRGDPLPYVVTSIQPYRWHHDAKANDR